MIDTASFSSGAERAAPVGHLPSHPAPNAAPWLHAVTHLDPRYGGLSAVVPELVRAVTETGRFRAQLAGFCHEGEHYLPDALDRESVLHLPARRLPIGTPAPNTAAFYNWAQAAEGLHIHGLWEAGTNFVAQAARKLGKPYIVSAHGMLEPWALRNKRLKKQLYLALVERHNLQQARGLHALTTAEADDYRRLGLRNPIAVIPNGVQVAQDVSPEEFTARFPGLSGKRLILFLGRIHFKKGLDLLCRAWADLGPSRDDAHLVLAGPDFENTLATVQRLVSELGIADSVTFTGMLRGSLKWSALAASECFVLPSYSEGLSVTTLEALGKGLPVIVTRQCHLPEVRRHDCGWVIEPDAEELRDALEAFLKTPSAAVRAMGHRARQLVARQYSWPVIGRQMSALYQWAQGGSLSSELDLRNSGGTTYV